MLTRSLLTNLLLSRIATASFGSGPGGLDAILLGMPALSPTMEKGNIAVWKKAVGDRIKVGDVLAEVETDKATVAFESQEEGYLAAIVIPNGTSDVVVGSTVGWLVETPEDVSKLQEALKSAPAASSAPAAASKAAQPKQPSANSTAPKSLAELASAPNANHLSPAVAHLIHTNHLDPSSIRGSGRGGRLLKSDVLDAIKKGTARKAAPIAAQSPAAPTVASVSSSSSTAQTSAAAAAFTGRLPDRSHTDLPLTQIRKVIAQRLTSSKQSIPHEYATVTVQIDSLLLLRDRLKSMSIPVPSLNDYIVKASALACRSVPVIVGDSSEHTSIDVSVAVATPTGLITPIVRGANQLGVNQISSTIKELAKRAKANALKPEEFQGGHFTCVFWGNFVGVC